MEAIPLRQHREQPPRTPPLLAAKKIMTNIFFHENPPAFLEEQIPLHTWKTTISTGRRGRRKTLEIPFLDVKPQESEHKPTLLFFPGMFEGVASPRPETMAYANALGIRAMTVDYASYGNLKTFLKEFPRFLDEQGVGHDVILSGSSLGGAVVQYVNHLPEFADRTKGMILSHTAHPSSRPHWGNMTFKALAIGQIIEHAIPWSLAHRALVGGNKIGGLRTVKTGDDMTDLDKAVFRYTVNESIHQHGTLKKNRAYSYIEFALSVTKDARWLRKPITYNSEVPVLWITTKNDPIMFTQSHDGVRKIYPQAAIYEFSPRYGHHTPSCRKEGLVEQIVPFLERYTVQ